MNKTSSSLLASGLLALLVGAQSCQSPEPSPNPVPPTSPSAGSPADYTIYTLQSQIGNKFVQVAGDTLQNQKYNNGAPLEQASALPKGVSSSFQQWHLISRLVGNVRYYQLRNVFSGKLLTSPSSTTGDQLVQQAETTALSDQQLWSAQAVDATSTSAYRLVNKANGLAIANKESSTSAGTAIIQETLQASAPRQQWALAAQAVRGYRDDQVTRFFERNDPAQGSIAFDGGASVPLSDGRVLWLTDDAYDGFQTLNPTTHLLNDGRYMAYNNSVLVQPTTTDWSNTAPNLTDSNIAANWTQWFARKIFNDPKADYLYGQRIWPNAGIEVGNHVYVQADETGVGTAIYDLTEQGGTNWAPSARLVPNGFSTASYGYGAGFVKSPDGYVYVYGAHYNSGDDLYVARFKANADSVKTGWRYWNGTRWSKNSSNAAIIGHGVSNTKIIYLNGKYVAVSMDVSYDCNSGRPGIFVSTSNSPTGSFGANQQKVHAFTEFQYGKRARAYGLNAHVQAVNGHDELLITYSMNFNDGGCAVPSPSGLRDPYFSRLKGVRIPYSLIPGL